MANERRKFRRKLVHSKVKVFHHGAGDFQAVTRDISNGGILVATDDYSGSINKGDEAKVIFLDSGEVNVVFNMKVVRITNTEIAMEIINCEKGGKVISVSDLRDIQR